MVIIYYIDKKWCDKVNYLLKTNKSQVPSNPIYKLKPRYTDS